MKLPVPFSFFRGLKVLFLAAILLPSCSTTDDPASGSEHSIWFEAPAANWNEALPVGNGRLGAMVFGDPGMEHLQLNEESVWCRKDDYVDVPVREHLDRARELLFQEKYVEAQQLLKNKVLQERLPGGTKTYQTLGDLTIEYPGNDTVTDYRRSLLLDRALAKVTFTREGKEVNRTVFSSAPDDMILFREEASEKGSMNCRIILSRPGDGEMISYDEGVIRMAQHVENGQGIKYVCLVSVMAPGGGLSWEEGTLEVKDADALELRIVAATDYFGGDPEAQCARTLADADGRSYGQILEDHIEEYQSYYNRVSLDLGGDAVNIATPERLARLMTASKNVGAASIESPAASDEAGNANQVSGEAPTVAYADPGLAELYFNFGRYLLISSSRPGNLPANLQGIWNESLTPPWNADYHVNINLQMNYWPACVTNLSECQLPFFEFLDALRESGRRTAEIAYGSKGFVVHHTTDAWHQTQLFGRPQWGMWPMGGAWSATHIWDHYLYTKDLQFLEENYPVMREAALFQSENLVQHPRSGKLVTGPSSSPENTFIAPSGEVAAISMGPAMDLQIIWHLFTSCIKAAELLETDAAFRNKLAEQLENLAPVEIGTDGRILEWSEESLKEASPGHRHMSHLYGLYPSWQYNWKDTPEYMEAARKVIEHRLEHGGGHTGWSRAWMINFFARLKDGDEAHHHLQQLFIKSTLPNLFDNHPPFQIDGNFGGTAGIAEMLLQSHSGYIELLPALPAAWPNGRAEGLMARGGFVIDQEWEDGALAEVKITSRVGGSVVVRYGDIEVSMELEEGEAAEFDSQLNRK